MAARGAVLALALLALAGSAGATTTWNCAPLSTNATYDASVCVALNDLYDASGGDNGALGALPNWRACASANPCDYCNPSLENVQCTTVNPDTFISSMCVPTSPSYPRSTTTPGLLTRALCRYFSDIALGSTIPASLGNFGDKLTNLCVPARAAPGQSLCSFAHVVRCAFSVAV